MEFSGLTKNHAGGGRETGNQFGVALSKYVPSTMIMPIVRHLHLKHSNLYTIVQKQGYS